MKNSLIVFSLLLICVLNSFAIESGRGIVIDMSQNSITMKINENGQIQTFTADQNTFVELISGQIRGFSEVNLKGVTINYSYNGNSLISAIVDYGGPNGEYIVIGGMDYYNLTSQTCKVNGTLLKLSSTMKYRKRGKEVTADIIKNTDLVKVLYTKDLVNDENIATEIDIVSGTYFDFKRTAVIKKLSQNKITIGHPLDQNLQEELIIHSSSKIYDYNFEIENRTILKVGTIIDAYLFFDSSTYSNIAYEIHVKKHPKIDEFYFVGRPLDINDGFFTTEFGNLNLLPTTKFSDFSGDTTTQNEFLQGEAEYFSANVIENENEFSITAIKEIPTIQTEFTFEGMIDLYDHSPLHNSFKALGIINSDSQNLELTKAKTRMYNFVFEYLDNVYARITTRKGSKVNRKSEVFSEVIAIDDTSNLNHRIFMGVITECSNTFITINDLRITLNDNTSFIKIDANYGSIADFKPGNYVIIEVNSGTELLAKSVYKFNQVEILSRISDIQNNYIVMGNLTFPIGDFTILRDQNNNTSEIDKLLPFSVVKIVSLYGATEAVNKLSNELVPLSSPVTKIARFIYVIDGPDPVSTNEPTVTASVYPNPSSTTVSIAAPENVVSDVTISIMLGERVFSKSNVTGTTQFSTASLPIGQYIVKISNNKSTTNQILQVIR